MENNKENAVYDQFPDWTTKDTLLCWITWLSLLGSLASFAVMITGGNPYPFAGIHELKTMPTVPGKWWEWGIASIMLCVIFCNTAGWGDKEEK